MDLGNRLLKNLSFVVITLVLGAYLETAAQVPPPPALPPESAPASAADATLTADLRMFAELDGNEDGILSGKEATSSLAYDANGDKRVSKAEFLAARAKARGVDPAVEDGKQFARHDGNEDDFLSGTEAKGLERYDANKDGEISRAEFMAGRAAERGRPNASQTRTGPASFDSFVDAIAQRDAGRIRSQMHPDLQAKVDEPVLQFLLDAIHDELGAMSDDEYEKNEETGSADGAPVTTTTATLEFQRGKANVEVAIHKGQITSFVIDSDQVTELDRKLGERLFSNKAFAKRTGDYFAPRGETMLRLIFEGKDEQAYGMLHPEVQQQLTFDDIQDEFKTARLTNGMLKKAEFEGLSVRLNDTGSLENVSLNYILDCGNGPAEGAIVVQFVGMSGALVGFNITKEVDLDPTAPAAAKTKTYRHDKSTLSASHAEKFVPFSFDYPVSWVLDAEAGTANSPNSVKLMRNVALGGGITYTQENFAVGSCQVSGSGELAKLGLQLLSQQFQEQVAKGFPEYKLHREDDMKFGKYEGYGFEFTSKLPHPTKDEVDCWGRIILIAPSTIGEDHGLSIVMLGTSEAPELNGLADLGVKGELPVIIRSFKIGEGPVAPPEPPPAAPNPLTPPPVP